MEANTPYSSPCLRRSLELLKKEKQKLTEEITFTAELSRIYQLMYLKFEHRWGGFQGRYRYILAHSQLYLNTKQPRPTVQSIIIADKHYRVSCSFKLQGGFSRENKSTVMPIRGHIMPGERQSRLILLSHPPHFIVSRDPDPGQMKAGK